MQAHTEMTGNLREQVPGFWAMGLGSKSHGLRPMGPGPMGPGHGLGPMAHDGPWPMALGDRRDNERKVPNQKMGSKCRTDLKI